MYFLSFETSTKTFSLALNQDEKVLRYRNIKSAFLLEDSILPVMDKMLVSVGLTFNQIEGFAIALGPGSFTSLRVGMSTVKAFAMGTGKPVVGIPSLDIICQGIKIFRPPEPGEGSQYDEICVINDARREKVYACIYNVNSPPLAGGGPYLLTTLEDVLEKVHGKTLFVGDGLVLYRKAIEEAYQNKFTMSRDAINGVSTHCKFIFAGEKWWYPQARVMAALAYERFKNKQYDDAASLVPLYLYPQDCQVTKARG